MPEKADGSIIISAEMDDKRAQSQLDALEKKVKKLQNSIEDMQSRRSPLVEQMQAYGAELGQGESEAVRAEIYAGAGRRGAFWENAGVVLGFLRRIYAGV